MQSRFILDSVALAEETIANLKDRQFDGMLVNIILRRPLIPRIKISLLEALRARGVSSMFTRWIRECLVSSRA